MNNRPCRAYPFPEAPIPFLMRLWLNHTGEVSLREQLTTQIVLAILTRELPPGHRLPSTRELARRFQIHSNTASSAYRQLESEGWVEFRHGSGVFVRSTRPLAPATPEFALDQVIAEMAAKARRLGIPELQLRARLRRWLTFEPPARWLLIEPDPELRRIVLFEMEPQLALPVSGCSPDECANPAILDRSLPCVLPSKAANVRRLLPAGTELTTLEIHPVAPELQSHLARYLPEHARELVGIVSRWGDFQRIARTMLIAAGLSPEGLLVRDATRPGWRRGLEATIGVVCDAATASDLPNSCHPLVFALLGEKAFQQLRRIEAALSGSSRSE
jgi:DNA-binding transcriptional regulator YhcF (GntR family)